MRNDYIIYVKKDNVGVGNTNGVNIDHWLDMLGNVVFASVEMLKYKKHNQNHDVVKVEINNIHWNDNHWTQDKMSEAAIKSKSWKEYVENLNGENPSFTDLLYVIQTYVRKNDFFVVFTTDEEISFNGLLCVMMNKSVGEIYNEVGEHHDSIVRKRLGGDK